MAWVLVLAGVGTRSKEAEGEDTVLHINHRCLSLHHQILDSHQANHEMAPI